jgi:anti-sigma regulatory factor (Ser/Thr protein kinase)
VQKPIPRRVATVRPKTWTRSYPARADQVARVRRFLSGILDACPATQDAILCGSELAGNAVLHSASQRPGGTFTIRAEVSHDHVRIEVQDNGGPWTEHTHNDGRPHGLDIIEALAADWGRSGSPLTGWVVWARLEWA